MNRHLQRIWSRLKATVLGVPCERCGARGAALVIEGSRTSSVKRTDGPGYLVGYTVHSCAALCPKCRG